MPALSDPHPLGVTPPGRAALATGPCEAPGTTRRPPSPKGANAASVLGHHGERRVNRRSKGRDCGRGETGCDAPVGDEAVAGGLARRRADASAPGPKAAPKVADDAYEQRNLVSPKRSRTRVPTPRGEGRALRVEDAGGSEGRRATRRTAVRDLPRAERRQTSRGCG